MELTEKGSNSNLDSNVTKYIDSKFKKEACVLLLLLAAVSLEIHLSTATVCNLQLFESWQRSLSILQLGEDGENEVELLIPLRGRVFARHYPPFWKSYMAIKNAKASTNG